MKLTQGSLQYVEAQYQLHKRSSMFQEFRKYRQGQFLYIVHKLEGSNQRVIDMYELHTSVRSPVRGTYSSIVKVSRIDSRSDDS